MFTILKFMELSLHYMQLVPPTNPNMAQAIHLLTEAIRKYKRIYESKLSNGPDEEALLIKEFLEFFHQHQALNQEIVHGEDFYIQEFQNVERMVKQLVNQ